MTATDIKEVISRLGKIRISDIRETAIDLHRKAFLKQNNRYFASVAFVPFVGWLVPLYGKPDDALCQKTGKEGLLLAVFFAGICTLLTLIEIFTPREYRIIRLIFILGIYLLQITYAAICVIGVRRLVREQDLMIPYVSDLAASLPL